MMESRLELVNNNEAKNQEIDTIGSIGAVFSRKLQIMSSMCDYNSKLSIPCTLDIFQNITSMHMDSMDIGPEGMDRRRYYWVITKMRLYINSLPKMREKVEALTWMMPPDRLRCERGYVITAGNEVLVHGRSMWSALSRTGRRPVQMKEFYPNLDYAGTEKYPANKPFGRPEKNFDESEEIGKYIVRSIDIDLGYHMNNVNYVRALLGVFSTEEIEKMNISELEFHYIHQVYEGETLRFVKRSRSSQDSDDGATEDNALFEIGAINEAGETVFIAHIW